MRPTLTAFFAVVALAALLAFPECAGAQAQAGSDDYAITKSAPPENLEVGEKSCTYFFYTTILGPTEPRINFTYILPDGKRKDEMPRAEDLSITLDPKNETPVVSLLGENDKNRDQFRLRMNAETYAKEKECLLGVTKKP